MYCKKKKVRYNSIEETSRNINISPTQVRHIINGECRDKKKYEIQLEIVH